MRRNYITNEYIYNQVAGTNNMVEEKSPLGSKILKLSDTITINSNNIFYYENANSEQINLAAESINPQKVFSIIDDKETNSNIQLDNTQTSYDKDKRTKWIININHITLLTDFIFYNIKASRAFEGITNASTISNNVDTAITQYINKNVLSKYQLSDIILYINYNSLADFGQVRYATQWNPSINQTSNIFTKFQHSTSVDNQSLIINFAQLQDSIKFNFDWYYDLIFTRLAASTT